MLTAQCADDFLSKTGSRSLRNSVRASALVSPLNRISLPRNKFVGLPSVLRLQSSPFEISNFNKLQFDPSEEKEMQQPIPIIQEPVRTTNDLKGAEHSLKVASIDHEYEVIVKTLKENNFNKSKAAKSLNIDRKTLYNKIALYQELVQKKSQQNEWS